MDLLKYNRHWIKGFRYPFPLKRDQFVLIKDRLNYRQIIELIGMRRTGKTTLTFQIINDLIDSEVDPFNIWYFTFDDNKYSLEELINEFQKQTRKSISNDKIYLILDEIQKLPDFQSSVKVYYDLYPQIKFIISGSTSLFIAKKTTESLAGRVFNIIIPPLGFHEYLHFRSKENILDKPQVFFREIEAEFEFYLSRQFIETLDMENTEIRNEYLLSILKKVIYEDIPGSFQVDNPEILFAIVKIIANQPGMYLNYQNLSNDLNISSKTLSKYISVLEQAFIIRLVYNYSTNQLTSEKKLKRCYLSSPSFIYPLTNVYSPGFVAENYYLSASECRFFWRDNYMHEVDFVEIGDEQITPVEIKYKTELKKEDFQNLYLFSRNYKTLRPVILMKRPDNQVVKYKDMDFELKSIYLSGK